MKAALVTRLDGIDAVEIADIAEPSPAAGEVSVRVHAVALNFMDTLLTRGGYQVRPELPFSPGAEIAGVVEACGPGVSGLAPGDRVAGFIGHGGARQVACAPAKRLSKVPDGVDLDVAAGVAVTYSTAIYALRERIALAPGAFLAVLGASGGAGLAAVEVGVKLGARVIAVASSDAKLQTAMDLGAAHGIDYTRADLKQALRDASDGHGPDVVYDCVGGDHAEAALRALRPGGEYIIIGFASGGIPKIPANIVLLKDCNVRGIHWSAAVDADPDGQRARLAELLGWVADGGLKPVPPDTRPLADIKAALTDIAERRAVGKIVLKP